jgi:hypothetical protein
MAYSAKPGAATVVNDKRQKDWGRRIENPPKESKVGWKEGRKEGKKQDVQIEEKE